MHEFCPFLLGIKLESVKTGIAASDTEEIWKPEKPSLLLSIPSSVSFLLHFPTRGSAIYWLRLFVLIPSRLTREELSAQPGSLISGRSAVTSITLLEIG